MERLFQIQSHLLNGVSDKFFRFLYKNINWKNRLIAIKGPRGSGKTTLILQYLKFQLKSSNALYASADHPFFYNHSLYDLAESFAQMDGKYLFFDEVHKAPHWAREVKSIYDSFPDMKIVITSSSALDLLQGEADLSRRVSAYDLPGLSFREYLNFHKKEAYPSLPLEGLLKHHRSLAMKISQTFRPLPLFRRYLASGYFPFSFELKEQEYMKRLLNIINTVLESDLTVIQGYTASNTQKIKRLLGTLVDMVPYEPNILTLSKKMQLGRDTVRNYLNHLQKARILNFLMAKEKGLSSFQKPDKIYLENTNLSWALNEQPERGTIRETFALNQLLNAGLSVRKPPSGDFLINGNILMEIGGKTKNRRQLKNLPDAYVFSDDIEVGAYKKVPLWLLGFLY